MELNHFKHFIRWSKKNFMSTIFSQQILNSRLLRVIMGRQKCNLICEFKLKPITIYHL